MKNKIFCLISIIIITGLALLLLHNQQSQNDILTLIKIDNKYGYKNQNDKIIIKPKYKKALEFCNERALVLYCNNQNECHVDLINKKGKRLNKEKIYSSLDFSNSLEVAQIKGQYGYINKCGVFIIKPQFTMATNFQEGLASVAIYDIDRRCNLWGYINESGLNKIPYQFFEATSFIDNIAVVKTITGYNIIDKQGRLLCKQSFLSDLPPLLQKNKRVFKYKINSDWVFGTNTEEIELDCNCNIIHRHDYNFTESSSNNNEEK